jgi:hypothetical protein
MESNANMSIELLKEIYLQDVKLWKDDGSFISSENIGSSLILDTYLMKEALSKGFKIEQTDNDAVWKTPFTLNVEQIEWPYLKDICYYFWGLLDSDYKENFWYLSGVKTILNSNNETYDDESINWIYKYIISNIKTNHANENNFFPLTDKKTFLGKANKDLENLLKSKDIYNLYSSYLDKVSGNGPKKIQECNDMFKDVNKIEPKIARHCVWILLNSASCESKHADNEPKNKKKPIKPKNDNTVELDYLADTGYLEFQFITPPFINKDISLVNYTKVNGNWNTGDNRMIIDVYNKEIYFTANHYRPIKFNGTPCTKNDMPNINIQEYRSSLFKINKYNA